MINFVKITLELTQDSLTTSIDYTKGIVENKKIRLFNNMLPINSSWIGKTRVLKSNLNLIILQIIGKKEDKEQLLLKIKDDLLIAIGEIALKVHNFKNVIENANNN